MQIRQLQIKNFRGIKNLDWTINSPIICLIGPGDSTKTTILDSIELALTPKWNINIDDNDFFEGKKENSIEICLTIGQLPEEFFKQEKFGLYTRGWDANDGIHDEPNENDENVLTIRLTIDETLEPSWTIFSNRNMEGKIINSKDRAKLNLNRLGELIDRHLSWGTGSALSIITEDKKDSSIPILIEAIRKAKETTIFYDIPEFIEAIDIVKGSSKNVGVNFKNELLPELDLKSINISQGAIALHDGNIPLRLYGTGSKRLLILGIQISSLQVGSCLLIDELENSLEPHRIMHLLKYLIEKTKEDSIQLGQVIMTSHSSIVIQELSFDKIKVVRSINGITTINNVSSELQGPIRRIPEALLGKKVIVCEGKTELGLCRSYEKYWRKNHDDKSLAYEGVVIVDGEGSYAPKRALALDDLGYKVCLFLDGDKIDELSDDIELIKKRSIKFLSWNDDYSTEQRIFNDIPFNKLQDILKLIGSIQNYDEIVNSITSILHIKASEIGKTVSEWINNGITEKDIINAIGKAAKTHGWIKRIDYGEKIGEFIYSITELISDKEIIKNLNSLEKWIYE